MYFTICYHHSACRVARGWMNVCTAGRRPTCNNNKIHMWNREMHVALLNGQTRQPSTYLDLTHWEYNMRVCCGAMHYTSRRWLCLTNIKLNSFAAMNLWVEGIYYIALGWCKCIICPTYNHSLPLPPTHIYTHLQLVLIWGALWWSLIPFDEHIWHHITTLLVWKIEHNWKRLWMRAVW